MKKFISIIICAILAAIIAVAFATSTEKKTSFFEQNVKALTRDTGVYGTCEEQSGECLIICHYCREKFYASDHKGPIKKYWGRCPSCGYELGTNQ